MTEELAMEYQYPTSWQALSLVPSARAEFMSIVSDCADWNVPSGQIKTGGADSVLDFLFDVYEIDRDARQLVGKLIFENELFMTSRFAKLFSEFIQSSKVNDPHLDRLAERELPSKIVVAAANLSDLLAKRGSPKRVS